MVTRQEQVNVKLASKPMSVPQPRHNHQMVLMPACLLKDKRALQAHAQLTPQAPILTQGSGGCELPSLSRADIDGKMAIK